jgi:hypothetical protein
MSTQPSTSHEEQVTDALHQVNAAATHALVGRTQRMVRERGSVMQSQKRLLRSLLLPILVCSAMVVMIAHSAWMVLEQPNPEVVESSVSSTPLYLLTLWFLPLTAGVLVMIWFRRGRKG